MRALRRADAGQIRAFRLFSGLLQISGMQEYQKNRKNDRYEMPQMRHRRDNREKRQIQKNFLRLQPVSEMRLYFF